MEASACCRSEDLYAALAILIGAIVVLAVGTSLFHQLA
jgi:hypothetical protein